jgi:hypothetical protein
MAAGFTSETLQRYAGELQNLTKFDDDTIISAQAVMATFTQVRGEVFKDALTSALDLSTVLKQDVQSSVVQIGKALNDPIRGITALSRVGVTFSEQQKEMIRTLVRSGDTMGAQRVILQELQREFGGAAFAAGSTFGGQLTQLQNAWGDAMEAIGFGLQDLMIGFFPELRGNIESFTAAVPEWTDALVTWLSEAQHTFQNFGSHVAIYLADLGIDAWRWVDTIGAALGYVGDLVRWGRGVFLDFFLAATDVFLSLTQNVASFVANLPGLMTGSVTWEDVWRPMGDAFRVEIESLPAFAGVVASETTKQMEAARDTLAGTLEADKQRQVQERLDAITKRRQERLGLGIKPDAPVLTPTKMGFGFGGITGALGVMVGEALGGVNVADVQRGVGDARTRAGTFMNGLQNHPLLQMLGLGVGGGAKGGKPAAAAAPALASMEASRFLTGVAAAGRERRPEQVIVKEIKSGNKLLERTNDRLTEITRVFRNAPAGAPLAFSGLPQ